MDWEESRMDMFLRYIFSEFQGLKEGMSTAAWLKLYRLKQNCHVDLVELLINALIFVS